MKDRVESALAEIREVLRRHNLAMQGACYDEGIAGQIEFIDLNDRDPRNLIFRTELDYMPTWGGSPYVEGIKP